MLIKFRKPDCFSTTNQIRILLAAIFFITPVIIKAQYDFHPGFIVLNSNDTINGFIDFKSPKLNSTVCTFKPTLDSKKIDYLPQDLKAYSFSGSKFYTSRTLYLEDTLQQYFFEHLVDGVLDLHYFIDRNKFRHFLIEESNKLHELTIENKTINIDGKKYKKNDFSYKKVLSDIMMQSPVALKKIEKTNLSVNSLTELVTTYHNSVNDSTTCIVFNRKKNSLYSSKWKIRVGASLGFNTSQLSLSTNIKTIKEYYFPEEGIIPARIKESNFAQKSTTTTNSKTSDFTFLPSLFLNISKNKRSSFQIEFLLFENAYKSSGYEFYTKGYMVPFMYKHEFMPYNKIRPFAAIGLSYNKFQKTGATGWFINYEYPRLDNDDDIIFIPEEISVNESNSNYITSFENIPPGILLSCGLLTKFKKKGRLEIELRIISLGNSFNSNFDGIFTTSSIIGLSNHSISVKISI